MKTFRFALRVQRSLMAGAVESPLPDDADTRSCETNDAPQPEAVFHGLTAAVQQLLPVGRGLRISVHRCSADAARRSQQRWMSRRPSPTRPGLAGRPACASANAHDRPSAVLQLANLSGRKRPFDAGDTSAQKIATSAVARSVGRFVASWYVAPRGFARRHFPSGRREQ